MGAALALLALVVSPALAQTRANDDPFEALETARRAEATNPDDPEAVLAVARAQVRLGAPGEALEAFERVRALAPEDPRGWVAAALVLRDVERVDAAIELLREALGNGVDAPAVAEQLGLLLLARGDVEEAGRISARALATHPGDGGLLLVHGLALAADPERRADAASWLEKALDAGAPNPGRIHLELGTLLSETSSESEIGCEQALEHFRSARELLGESSEALYRLGTGLARCGDAESAREVLARFQELRRAEEAADHGSRSTGAALNEAQRLANDGEIDAALERLDALAAEHPDDARIFLLRARIRFGSGRRVAGLEDAARARELGPGRVEAHYLEGLFASQLGKLDQASDALGRALAVDPEHAPSLALAGALDADAGRFEEAAEHLRLAFLHGAEGRPLRLAYARVLDALDRPEDAARQRALAGDG